MWALPRLPWRAPWQKRHETPWEKRLAIVNVKSEIAGNVWKIQLKPGDKVELEGEIMILESMKMEIPVLSPKGGTIKEIKVAEGEAIAEGQLVAIIDG
jgi:biotin carboxyl carrier protein